MTAFYLGLLAFAVASRQLVELDVLRDRNALYRTLDDGRIENVYTLRVINKDVRAHDKSSGIGAVDLDRPEDERGSWHCRYARCDGEGEQT